jgi:hypothetical protein
MARQQLAEQATSGQAVVELEAGHQQRHRACIGQGRYATVEGRRVPLAGAAARPGRGRFRQGFAALVAGSGNPRQLGQAAEAEVEAAAAWGATQQAAGWV